ncbi:RICIN domain-containing protein [Trinickia fusca]|uniref:Ricin B lectin domain-containing protein n=1 Tax=Trinickia fusca TaxID=2419777 RepID=A0A494XEQ8_9BURK|nr:RICIN domain-containing protein [Trinickia fusca]RKP46073.1 hypothetical protein D7S89_19105 [Trinickia fusca]
MKRQILKSFLAGKTHKRAGPRWRLASLIASVACTLMAGSTAAHTDDSWMFSRPRLIGFNWADPNDNFQAGQLNLSGTLPSYTYQSFYNAGSYVGSTFKAWNTNVNTVRIPINYATVSNSAYWSQYRGAIDGLLASGVYVVICYWPDGKDGLGVPYGTVNESNWLSAWGTVLSQYITNPQVYFEPINEPWGYSTWGQIDTAGMHDTGNLDPLKQLYHDWEGAAVQSYRSTTAGAGAASLPGAIKHRVILGGGMVEEDVKDLANDSSFDDYLLGFHMYAFVWQTQHGDLGHTGINPNELRRHTDWPAYLAGLINRYWPRVVITEFGAETNLTGYDATNAGYDSSGMKIPSIQGMANYSYTYRTGMIWWPGFKGSYTQGSSTPQSISMDQYDFFKSNAEAYAGQYSQTPYLLLSSTPSNAGLATLLSAASLDSSAITSFIQQDYLSTCPAVTVTSYNGNGGALFNRSSWASAGPAGDQFSICNDQNSDGFYNITNLTSQAGSVVDVNGNSTIAGAGLDFYSVNGQQNQKWLPIVAALGSHPIYFTSEHNYQLMEVRGDPGAASTQSSPHDLDQWPLNGGLNQQWAVH